MTSYAPLLTPTRNIATPRNPIDAPHITHRCDPIPPDDNCNVHTSYVLRPRGFWLMAHDPWRIHMRHAMMLHDVCVYASRHRREGAMSSVEQAARGCINDVVVSCRRVRLRPQINQAGRQAGKSVSRSAVPRHSGGRHGGTGALYESWSLSVAAWYADLAAVSSELLRHRRARSEHQLASDKVEAEAEGTWPRPLIRHQAHQAHHASDPLLEEGIMFCPLNNRPTQTIPVPLPFVLSSLRPRSRERPQRPRRFEQLIPIPIPYTRFQQIITGQSSWSFLPIIEILGRTSIQFTSLLRL